MPHVSKHKLEPKREKQLLQSLEIVLSNISRKPEMNTFLYSLFSYTERLMLAKRLGIVLLLKEGFSETEIASALNVTRQTVYRIKQSSEFKNNGYELALKALKKDKQVNELKKMLIDLARYSIRASTSQISTRI